MRINDVFERVLVLNLDRRPDRMAAVSAQLERLGIGFERFAAVDGRDDAVASAWRGYLDAAPAPLPPGARPVTSYREFYLDYGSEAARVAFFEAETGQRGIATAGAWGLLASMTAIAETALRAGWRSLLVLEDDVRFHKDTAALFARCMAELPPDWQIFQLGAMQLHWEPDWITWHSAHLYRCNGSSLGAHAFGLRRDVLPHLVEACHRRELPFDIGALHAVKRRFADACFTAYPNIAIQDAADSEIGMSRMFFREARKTDNVYRWHLPDYGLQAIDRATGRASAPKPGPATRAASRQEKGASATMDRASRRVLDLRRRLRSRVVNLVSRPMRNGSGALPEPTGNESTTEPGPSSTAFSEPRLQPFVKERPTARSVIAVVTGLRGDDLVRVIDMLQESGRRMDVVPIFITDSSDFEPFRLRRAVFEYLPSLEQQSRRAPGLDWELYRLRRLALLRRKWQPARIVAFGAQGTSLLDSWLESPFEDRSIAHVLGRPPVGDDEGVNTR